LREREAAGAPKGLMRPEGQQGGTDGLAEEFEKQGAFDRSSLVQTGCLGLCQEGPLAAVFPDNVFYRDLTAADAKAIVKEHLLEGKALPNKTVPDRDWY